MIGLGYIHPSDQVDGYSKLLQGVDYQAFIIWWEKMVETRKVPPEAGYICTSEMDMDVGTWGSEHGIRI